MKLYAVIDTNVLVSALMKWDSIPGQVLQRTYAEQIVPVYNREIFNEYTEVLNRAKFHFPKDKVKFLLTRLKSIGINLDSVESLNGNFPDPDDIIFFEVAMESEKTNETYLVTGNIKHFPQHPKIVTPSQMLNILIECE